MLTANLTGGSGDDSIYVLGNAPVTFDMSKGGAGIATGYTITDGEDGTNGIVEALINDSNPFKFSDGAIEIDKAKITFTGNTNATDGTIFNLFGQDADGNDVTQAVGFTHSDGGTVDVSKDAGSTFRGGKENLILFDANDTKRDGAADFFVATEKNAVITVGEHLAWQPEHQAIYRRH